MKKILLIIFLFLFSDSSFAHDKETEKSIKDIAVRLALINQQLMKIHITQEANLHSNEIMDCRFSRRYPDGVAAPTSAKHFKSVTDQQAGLMFLKTTQNLFESAIIQMLELKKDYDKDPYIFVRGFDINIGIPPSVTVSLEFKKKES